MKNFFFWKNELDIQIEHAFNQDLYNYYELAIPFKFRTFKKYVPD